MIKKYGNPVESLEFKVYGLLFRFS